mmetsp:Transcript_33013/g.91063  ORF Transcript_33013/g.91063 Transcript_33013/m.91063 type:complete len:169 (+) Transcript_33013:134-640(+)
MARIPPANPLLVENVISASENLQAIRDDYSKARAVALSWLFASCDDSEMLDSINDMLQSRLGQAFDVVRVFEAQAHATQDQDEAFACVDTSAGLDVCARIPEPGPSKEGARHSTSSQLEQQKQPQRSEPLSPHVEKAPVDQYILLQKLIGHDDVTHPSPRGNVHGDQR